MTDQTDQTDQTDEPDERWLREGLASAVPEPPTNPDRARSAERLARRRRRTTMLAVAGTAAAVVAGAVLATTLTGDGGDGRAPDDQLVADPAPPVACPPAEAKDGVVQGSEIDQPDPDAPDSVPEGATSARLCQGPGTTFRAPDDALTTGVDDLVAAINALEPTGEPEVCTMDLGPGFRIAFGYDDGSAFVVSGQLYGCHTLVVGSGYRSDPEAAQAAFLTALEGQQPGQESTETTTDAEGLACPDDGSYSYSEPAGGPSLDEVLGDLETAILCVPDGTGAQVSAAIEPADLALLVEDMATHQSNSVLRCALPPPYPTIVAEDSVGTRVVLFSECGTGFWRLPNGMAWMPGKDAVAILDRLVSEAD
ncbi:hypothetical protein [Nocardioides pelophilus]|uniref:hypothetical protein n=1 Tax=Nocardioides pelophilus TaxID=2172019 RepID=UPI001601E033|nr:hypothetical protein [Nocardioides pelophilus]